MEQAAQQREEHKFSSHAEFSANLLDLVGRSRLRLRMFDPDYAFWHLGSLAMHDALQHFLAGHGRIELIAHRNTEIEANSPRFMRLLKDYGHLIECRVTSKNLRQLTDSFCIGDEAHIVRRFHSDHMRGEAVFHGPDALQVSAERFFGIWSETDPGLHATTLGL